MTQHRKPHILVSLMIALAWTMPVSAQGLTPAQLQTLKTDIQADATLNAFPNSADGNAAIAAAYDVTAAPDFWVWKTRTTKDDLVAKLGPDGTSFAWTGTGYITRSQGERDGFNAIFDSSGAVNPSLANVRQAFADIFSGGTAPAPANRTHLLAVSRRKATRVEKLFATGTGSTAVPGLMAFEGQMTGSLVEQARNLP